MKELQVNFRFIKLQFKTLQQFLICTKCDLCEHAIISFFFLYACLYSKLFNGEIWEEWTVFFVCLFIFRLFGFFFFGYCCVPLCVCAHKIRAWNIWVITRWENWSGNDMDDCTEQSWERYYYHYIFNRSVLCNRASAISFRVVCVWTKMTSTTKHKK